MLDQNDLQAIANLLKPILDKVESIEKDVGVLKEDADESKEGIAEVRAGVNKLLEWAEEASVEVKVPLFKKAE